MWSFRSVWTLLLTFGADSPENVDQAFETLGISDLATQRIILTYLKTQFPAYFNDQGGNRPDPPKFNLDVRFVTLHFPRILDNCLIAVHLVALRADGCGDVRAPLRRLPEGQE